MPQMRLKPLTNFASPFLFRKCKLWSSLLFPRFLLRSFGIHLFHLEPNVTGIQVFELTSLMDFCLRVLGIRCGLWDMDLRIRCLGSSWKTRFMEVAPARCCLRRTTSSDLALRSCFVSSTLGTASSSTGNTSSLGRLSTLRCLAVFILAVQSSGISRWFVPALNRVQSQYMRLQGNSGIVS